jgi:putative ABC transport system permease protein
VILSYALWHQLFGDNRAVVDSTIVLNGAERTVVGVMPPSFRFPDGDVQFWLPAQDALAYWTNRDQYQILSVGRLARGASIEQARAELETIASRLRADWPKYNSALRIEAIPLKDASVGAFRTRLWVLMGAVAFLLLITCANLGNLQLARASSRRREIAVRRAIGASRGRITRQLLTESLMLAVAGGMLGVAGGEVFLKLLLAAQTSIGLPRAQEIHLNGTVLLFTLAISLGAGLFFGMLPALDLTRERATAALREGARGSSARRWTRNSLVVAEVALAVVLLAGAGLLLRSFALLQDVSPGFTNTQLLTFTVSRPQRSPDFETRAVERVQALPGVEQVALASQLPITGRGAGAWFNRLDKPLPDNVKPTGAAYRVVTPNYFEVIGLRLQRGRVFTEDDRADRPVLVINRALADHYYPGEDPIGKEVYLGAPDNKFFDRGVIVGVVDNTLDAGLGAAAIPIAYMPKTLTPWWRSYSFIVRARGTPFALANPARAAIHAVDPSVPVRNMQLVSEVLNEAVAPARWSTTLLGVFAAIALLMAAVGVFGVLSFLVAQRTREIGIRIALGAAPGSVSGMVVRHGLGMVCTGIVLGSAGALALTRFMTSMLFGVAPTDAVTYAVVAGLLVSVGFVASYLPALRATRIDPLVAMRAE